MTEVIKEPKKRSRVNLIILLAFLVLLIVMVGYGVYGWGLKRSELADNDQIEQNNQNNNLIDNQKINNESNQAASIPDGWKEYELSECGVIIQIPEDWEISGNQLEDKTFILLSPDWKIAIQKNKELGLIFEGPFNDIEINCYESLTEFTKEGWELNKKDGQNLIDPINLLDALTRKGTVGPSFSSVEPSPIMGISDAQEVEIADKKAFVGYQIGGPGAVLTYYFENPKNRKIISFESEMTEYQEKRLKKPHSQIIENFQWLE